MKENKRKEKERQKKVVKYINNVYIFTTDYPHLCAGASLAEPLHSSVTFFFPFFITPINARKLPKE
jgi:hypothetical protein